ncbi:hypothetical protein [Chelatococcus reniformis]|uniref:Uncharacterized protein n=1 Tax=Chelatococcus reniformis TaxID=1494448 RepID=A0A916XA23_9HYPH|nr:hypothetical protein [Chelatococcus reniformis]GGC58268.1 hypothetical protein GCM10010994_16500 [Chelatococcus reniformis]
MTAAPFGADYEFSVGATVQFTGLFTQADESPWPIDEYRHEWTVWNANSSKIYTGTLDNGGIIISPTAPAPENSWITFNMGEASPCPGIYTHVYRIQHKMTGEYIVPLDGILTITGSRF